MSNWSRQAKQSSDNLYRVLARDFKGGRKCCAFCGRFTPYKRRTVDHIIPMWRFNGSELDTRNWQMLCIDCHRHKSKVEDKP